ncbi:RNA polymerase sigma factor [Winogradskyella sp.]|uniref:RNA polymerase sigma factor n=1 Tax=Winogradskyella sp. TaxID=1883156 RepID=UPI0025E3BA8B|nr:RNA polymerase sigma factor [Winogradskyella sp.]
MKKDQSIDEELVKAFKAGDKKALATLVRRWHKLFCDKAYWLVKDKDAAKDIAQDSWTIIINKIDGLKNPEQFQYWAYRIVCNKSTDWLRLQTKKRKRIISYEIEIESNDSKKSEKEQLKQLLLIAINRLPDSQKTVVRLFYIESYSLKQISELLEISVGTAKSRLFHAREKLKRGLTKHKNE